MYFDLQVNGYAGVDFQSPDLGAEELNRALLALRGGGRTFVLLTLITDTIEALCGKLENMERLLRDSPAAEIVKGYHLEGPYLSPRAGFCGVHPAELMKAPDLVEFDRLWRSSNSRLKLITLAPEWAGSDAFIAHAIAHGVRTAVGHSDAGNRELDLAVGAGLTLCTHVGNGVPMELHRHDNIIQRLLVRDELTAVFIPDGIHVGRDALRNFVRAKPRDKVLFTTDCMAAAGAPAGRYQIGRVVTEVGADGIVREPGRPNFAGSSLTMPDAFQNVRRLLDWSDEDAFAACSWRVAKAVGCL